ncbi:hypothetical protein [Streptomyces cyaneofuscatus]|uniref:hypothetical protein n=1 Tax=Streptomyces cyaneofuscatus TaxID=66883 RepID=UPI0036523E2B
MAQHTTPKEQPSQFTRIIELLHRWRRTFRNVTDVIDYAAKALQKVQAVWEEWIPATAH